MVGIVDARAKQALFADVLDITLKIWVRRHPDLLHES
jgi:hypothetical protein